MAISDAQFSAWLASDEPRAILAEVDFGYESAGAPATGTLYFATVPGFTSRPTDSPPHQPYRDVILSVPRFPRAIDIQSLGGRGTFSVSDFTLANADGALDFLMAAILDGYEARFFIGSPSWPRSDFRTVTVAVVERAVAPAGEQSITLKLRDKRLLLDAEVKGDAVGGTGPNSTKYLPLLYGSHQNLEALVYDATVLIYSVVSNFGVDSIAVDVRDGGESLRSATGGWTATAANTTVNAGTDTFTKVAHGLSVNDVMFFADPFIVGGTYTYWAPFPGMSARPYWVKTAPTVDTFTLSATKGGGTLDITGTTWSDSGFGFLSVVRQEFYDDLANTGRIQLSGNPSGRITVDVLNGGNIVSPFQLGNYLIKTFGNVADSEVDDAAFTAADTALDVKVSLGYSNLAILERRNLLDVLDEMFDACFGWYGVSHTGKITCGLVDPSGLSTFAATREIAEADIVDYISLENLPVTISRVNVNYDANLAIQTDGVVAIVPPETRALYSTPWRKIQRSTAPSGTAYSTNKPLYHKTMVEGAPRNASLMNSSAYGTDTARAISSFADEIVEDRRPQLQVLRCTVRLAAFEWELGEVVKVTHPRYGISAGKNFRLMGVDPDVLGETVDLTLLTYTQPSYSTGSYP